MRDLAVVIVAAGKGERLGASSPKAFVALAGKPLLAHALENVAAVTRLNQVIIAAPESHVAETRALLAQAQLAPEVAASVVVGGQTRQQSVANALAELNEKSVVVLVHDSARALASADIFNSVTEAVLETGSGVIPTLPVVDTIKKVAATQVLETADRSELAIAQTPQGFLASKLIGAYAHASADYTDDAATYQAFGGSVISVPGEANAFKITTPQDLAAAERLFAANQRTGIGTDTHRFGTTGSLKLAGIDWPELPALEGHSDGDAVAHAVVDSLLAAAGLGDIGSNFGVDRPEYSGASGEVFIRATVELLTEKGFKVVNVSVQVISNKPKIGPRRAEAESTMSELVGAPVTIGATTTDGLGFLGNSEGIAAVATALISGGNHLAKDRLNS